MTLARIDTIKSFCGKTIRDYKGDSSGMSRATHAILKHYSSALENPNHEDCIPGKNSWCSYNCGVASGTNYHQPIKNLLPPAVVAEMQPLFDRLGSKEFLASCEDSKTHSVNESHHHVVWNLATIKFSIGD